MISKHGMLMVCSMVEMKISQNHHSTDKQYFQWTSWIFIEDTNGKKAIFGNVDFPHIKSILKKCFKNTSLFFVLAFKILYTGKVTFLKGRKNIFLSLDLFLEVPWLWKHVEKMCWKISVFFIKSKFWYDQFSIFYLDATVGGVYWDSTAEFLK